MIPAFAVIALGAHPTSALVISQVVLSIALPLPMISLIIFTSRADLMGSFANSGMTRVVAIAATIFVLALNAVLIYLSFT
jgi:manganese transport protein